MIYDILDKHNIGYIDNGDYNLVEFESPKDFSTALRVLHMTMDSPKILTKPYSSEISYLAYLTSNKNSFSINIKGEKYRIETNQSTEMFDDPISAEEFLNNEQTLDKIGDL